MTKHEAASDSSMPVKTQWHRILGTLFELLLTPVGITVQTEVQVMSDPPKVDILLLRRESPHWTERQLQLLCDGLRDTEANNLLLEFKYSESFNESSLLQALSYDFFYRQAQQLSEQMVQSFVVVARTPRSSVLRHYGYVATDLPGVLRSTQPLLSRIIVIVLNQLQSVAHNAFVQCFASRRNIRQSAFTQLQQMDQHELSQGLQELLVGLNSRFEIQEETMGKSNLQEGFTAEDLMKLGREVRRSVLATLTTEERKALIASASPEERKALIASASPEERKMLIASASPEERKALIASASPEERKALIASASPEERLEGLSTEGLNELIEQIEHYLHQQANKSPSSG